MHPFPPGSTGGAIEVVANDLTTKALPQQIRAPPGSTPRRLPRGDFGKPLETTPSSRPNSHDDQQRRALAFVYEELAGAGRVRITARTRKAIDAVLGFSYQIGHRTGDSVEMSGSKRDKSYL